MWLVVFSPYQIKSKGSLCREKVNDCDLPEFCDGKSSIVSLSSDHVYGN